MEQSLFFALITASLAITLFRVRVLVGGAKPEGRERTSVALSTIERLRFHRSSFYFLGTLLLLGTVAGAVSAPIAMVTVVGAYGIAMLPVRYRLTTTGIGINNVLFRPWSEFEMVEYGRQVILRGKPGNRDLKLAVSPTHARVLASVIPLRRQPSGGGRSWARRIGIPATVALVLLTVTAGSAFADGPDDPPIDVSGTTVGAPEDLAGIGAGGGSLAVIGADGTVDAEATAKLFSDASQNEPFAYNLAAYVNQNRLAINFVWVLVAGFLVMFMQAGFAMVETGFCRAKSAMHVMMTNFMVYGIGMLAFWAVGFAIMFGGVGLTGPTNLGAGLLALDKEFTISIAGTDWGIFGHKGFFLGPNTLDVGVAVLFLFQMVFMDTAATILTGATAERWTWISFCIWGVVVGGFVYPVFGNWAWGGGWLFQLKDTPIGRPYVDFAGSGVVHSVGGWAAAAAAIVLGPRLGKYNADGSPNAIPGHNINMAAIGTFILAFGWFGFNPGSTLGASGSGNLRIGEVAVVTMLAGAAGSVTSMLYAKTTLGKYDPGYMINGLLAGLVAITAPSGYVSPILAVLIGGIAGVLVCLSLAFVERALKIDDPVGAISVHGVGGVFGVLCVGLFADGTAPDFLVVGHPIKGLFFGDPGQFVAQLVGAATVMTWAFGSSFVLFTVLKKLGIFRSKPEDELAGLDLPEMGTHAYPVEDVPSERGIEPGTFIPGYTAAPATG